MIRYLLAGLLGLGIWAAIFLSGWLAGPGLVSAGLVASILAALAGQALGARHRGQATRQSASRSDSSVPEKQAAPSATPTARVARPAPIAPPARSDAITLLATLQREARFVDLVQESLTDYSDAQVGAAARDVLRDCRTVLDRFFDLQPVVAQPEGTSVEIPAGQVAGRYRMTGTDQAGTSGRRTVVHHGWEAQKCQLPQWSGSQELTLVVAPAEIEGA